MATVNGTEYDHIDIKQGSTTTKHMLKDATARVDIENLKSAFEYTLNDSPVDHPLPLIVGSTRYWAQPTGSHIMIPVAPGDSVSIKANSSNAAYYGFLRSFSNAVNGGAIDYSTETGFTGRLTVAKNGTATYTVPNDAHWLAVNNYYTTSFLPARILVNGHDALVGNKASIETVKTDAEMLPFGYGTSVPSGADLNNYTTPGNYYVATVAIATSLANGPVFEEHYYGGKLTVKTLNSVNAISQIYEAAAPARVAWRVYSSGTWSLWQYVATKSSTDALATVVNKVASAVITNYAYADSISSEADLNDYTTPGNYYIATQAIANSVTNVPVFQDGMKYAGRLTVTTINSTAAVMQEYIAAQSSYRAWRKKSYSGWTVWFLGTTYQTVDVYKERSRAIAIGSFNAVRNVMKTTEYNMAYANAPIQMDFENYLGNTQNVHPKVLYFENGFSGHKYWMAYTPYPFSNDTVENPCVAYSDDGYSWTNISANPLATADIGAYNSDTHLVYNGTSLECWYRRVGASVGGVRTETIYRRTSTDGITWTAEQQVMFNDGTETGMGYSKLLSPAVIWDGSKYCMWVIANTTYIDYYESSNTSDWTLVRRWKLKPRGEADIRFNEDDTDHTNTYPWHLDVIKDGSTYIMLIMCRNTTDIPGAMCSLFIITSSDNITYSANGTKVVGGSTDNWDKYMYRSSIVKIGDVYRIYYSAGSGGTSTIYNNAVWGLGVTESNSLSGFIGRLVTL